MKRRDFLSCMGGTSGLLGLSKQEAFGPSVSSPHRTGRPAPHRRPNLVLFLSDDHTIGDCGAYGNKIVRTPHLDRLASESLRFTQAFAASPTCSPSRASMFSGLMPMRHGAHPNHGTMKPDIQTLPHYLKPLGYATGLFGKVDVRPAERMAFDAIIDCARKKHGGLDHDRSAVKFASEWLDSLSAGQPFCLVVASADPHVPWLSDAKYGYGAGSMDIDPTFIDTPETRKSRTEYYSDVSRMDERVGDTLDLLEQRRLSENTLFLYTADQGAQWPFAKWNLYESAIHVPMFARWPGVIKGGKTTSAMISHVDLLPTFVRLAGGDEPPNSDGLSFVDVLRGKTRRHRDAIFATHTRDGKMNVSPMRCVRTERYKYILNLQPDTKYTTHIDLQNMQGYWDSWEERAKTDSHASAVLQRYHWRPKEELYDLDKDPAEQHNLASSDGKRQVLGEMRRRLAAWRDQQGDE